MRGLHRRHLLAVVLAVVLVLAGLSASVHAAIFDLHNLGSPALVKNITVDGITLGLQGTGSGNLTSTASQFGIDGSGAADAPDLLDGGNGVAESLSFLFSSTVVVDSINISLFDGADAGTVNIKGQLPTLTLHDGVNVINQTAGNTSVNFLTYTGPLTSGGTNGFSVDSITVHATPEPAAALTAGALSALMMWRRRSRRNQECRV